MNCPKCGDKTYIIDTRASEKYQNCIRRRRMCYRCGTRFTTYEVLPQVFKSGEKAKEALAIIKEALK